MNRDIPTIPDGDPVNTDELVELMEHFAWDDNDILVTQSPDDERLDSHAFFCLDPQE